MSRYIDVDYIAEYFAGTGRVLAGREIRKLANSSPDETVELVHCEDCIWSEESEFFPGTLQCTRQTKVSGGWKFGVLPRSHCSFATQKQDEENG